MKALGALLVAAAIGVMTLAGGANAQVITGTFTGTVIDSYNNASGTSSFNGTVARGSLIVDASDLPYNGYFFTGPGIQLTFNAGGETSVWGGIGNGPSEPGGTFTTAMSSNGQTVYLSASNFQGPFAATLTLNGLANAFGPNGNLTPLSFQPGTALMNGSSVASFGDRLYGATIILSSLTLTEGATTVISTAVPEVPAPAMLLVGALGLMLIGRHRSRVAPAQARIASSR